MLKTEMKEIGGLRFTTTQLPAMRGFKLFTKLVKVAGPILGALGELDPEASMASVAGPLAAGLQNLDPEEVVSLSLEILVNTSAVVTDQTGDRKIELTTRENIDKVFNGRLRTLLEVLAFAIRVNFSDFFASSGADPALPATATSVA